MKRCLARRKLDAGGGWDAAHLRRLALAVAAEPVCPYDDEVAVFVDAEQRGENARALYPRLWQHIQECTHCWQSYSLLKESLEIVE